MLENKIGQSTSNMEELEKEYDTLMIAAMSKATSSIIKECLPDGLMKRFPKNNFSAMVLTGAKGRIVN